MVTVEAAIALCSFVTVVALVLAGMSMMLDQIRCLDAAREGARLVAMGERDAVADTVRRIAPGGATVSVATLVDGIVVTVRDPAAGGLLPGVHVTADAYAVPEPPGPDDSAADSPSATGSESPGPGPGESPGASPTRSPGAVPGGGPDAGPDVGPDGSAGAVAGESPGASPDWSPGVGSGHGVGARVVGRLSRSAGGGGR